MKIGIFDSGIGGLSVLNAFIQYPIYAEYFYIADSKYAPYGQKSKQEIDLRVYSICQHFIKTLHVDLIVIACNTATATSAEDIREIFPNTPILGIEPAIKPAAHNTMTHEIAITATTRTLQSKRLQSLIEKYANNMIVHKLYADCWVPEIEEKGPLSEDIDALIHKVLLPIQNTTTDQLILGCTHFPFIEERISLVAPSVTLLNPALSVAQYGKKMIQKHGFLEQKTSEFHYYTTGHLDHFTKQIHHLAVPDGTTEVLLI